MKKLLAVLLTLALAFCAAACAPNAAEPDTSQPAAADTPAPAAPDTSAEPEVVTYDTPEVTLVFPEINAEAGDVCKLLYRFSDTVLERTNGRVKIEVFGGGQLGTEAETVEQLLIGVTDFIRINPANASTRGIDVPEYTAMGLPYLIQSIDGGLEYLYSASGQAIADKVTEATGGQIISLYNYIVTTPRHMYTKTLITSLDEMQKQKIRSETSEIKVDMINCWASATPLAMNEIYTALQTGVIDGCENAIHGYVDNAWYEVAPYMLETGHSINASIFLMSGVTLNKITEDEHALIIEALKEACDWFQETQMVSEKAMYDLIAEKGVTVTAPTDPEAWQEAVLPLYEKYAAGLEGFISEIQSYK